MKRRQLLLSALLTTAAAPTRAQARRIYTVGVEDYENFLPYSEWKNGVYSGLGRDMLDAFASTRGLEFRYVVLPLKRRDAMFVRGDLDFIFPDNPNWVTTLKGNLRIAYAPMMEFTDGVLVRPQDLGKGVARIKVLGIPNGFTPYPYQQLINSGQMRIEESVQYDRLYEKLQRGRVDGAYLNTRIAEYYFAHAGSESGEAPVFDPDLPHASGHWYLSSYKHPAEVLAMRDFMRDRLPQVEEMKQRWKWR